MPLHFEKTFALDDLPAVVAELSPLFKGGDCICLDGEMGAGKTTVLFQLMQHWRIDPQTPFGSPTFTLQNLYATDRGPVYHLDLYRLNHARDLESLELEGLDSQNEAISFVEWGQKFAELTDLYTHVIKIESVPGNDQMRRLTVDAVGL